MMQVERWTLLIVREALLRDTTRFPDFQMNLGVAPDLLAARLDDLVGSGLMEVTPQSHYALTPKGRDLESTISEFSRWSDRWPATSLRPLSPPFASRDSPVAQHFAEPEPGGASDAALNASVDRVIAGPHTPGSPDGVTIEISVLGAFALKVGGRSVGPLPVGSQRLLVFLALHDRAVGRAAMAGRMWPEATDERAGISLRSALSRLDAPTREAILTASAGLSLAPTVIVDLRLAQSLAARLLHSGVPTLSSDLTPRAVALLSSELLPDWYDDWVVAEAEDWRQVRVNALEALSATLTDTGRLADAAAAARAAIKVEPLRESAHASLIRVHLAEGNQSEALRVFERYRLLLTTALGLEPTEHLSGLVSNIKNR